MCMATYAQSVLNSNSDPPMRKFIQAALASVYLSSPSDLMARFGINNLSRFRSKHEFHCDE